VKQRPEPLGVFDLQGVVLGAVVCERGVRDVGNGLRPVAAGHQLRRTTTSRGAQRSRSTESPINGAATPAPSDTS
jgi:hypothetical protein